MLLFRCPVGKSNTSTVFCSSDARNKRLPCTSSPKWSKSPVKPGIGVVAINFSGSFSCALPVSTHRNCIITQILSNRRNFPLLENSAIQPLNRRVVPFLKRTLPGRCPTEINSPKTELREKEQLRATRHQESSAPKRIRFGGSLPSAPQSSAARPRRQQWLQLSCELCLQEYRNAQ